MVRPASATAARRGRERAVAVAWEQHRPGLLRYATSLLDGDRYAAEDIVQEAIVRLWRYAGPVEEITSMGGWLATVVRHLVVDRSRRRAARPTEVGADSGQAPLCEDESDEVLSLITVWEILRVLGRDQRAAMVEVYVHDRSVREAATALGVPEGTVKSRCHYALRALRDAGPQLDAVLAS